MLYTIEGVLPSIYALYLVSFKMKLCFDRMNRRIALQVWTDCFVKLQTLELFTIYTFERALYRETNNHYRI